VLAIKKFLNKENIIIQMLLGRSRSFQRYALHQYRHTKPAFDEAKAAAPGVLCRRFFWGKSKDPETLDIDDSNTKKTSDEKGIIVPAFGDESPRPNKLIALPITRRPLFPGLMSAVIVRDEKTTEAILKHAELGTSYVGTFLRSDNKPGEIPELITSVDQIHPVGTFAQVQSILRTDGGLQLLLMGHRRISLENVVSFGPPVMAKVSHWNKSHVAIESSLIKAYRNEIILAIR
jgi:hypothetical protein